MAKFIFEYWVESGAEKPTHNKLTIKSSSITGAIQKGIKMAWDEKSVYSEDIVMLKISLDREDEEGPEPDLMGPDWREEAERMHRIQRDLK
jgi:hypothetical protein